jgi:hypothetical protein
VPVFGKLTILPIATVLPAPREKDQFLVRISHNNLICSTKYYPQHCPDKSREIPPMQELINTSNFQLHVNINEIFVKCAISSFDELGYNQPKDNICFKVGGSLIPSSRSVKRPS